MVVHFSLIILYLTLHRLLNAMIYLCFHIYYNNCNILSRSLRTEVTMDILLPSVCELLFVNIYLITIELHLI